MRGKEHSVPRKITSCPAPWVIPEGFLRSGSCLRPWAKRDTRVFSFLGSPQLKREVCRADKLGFWRQETLFRNNVPFPAAQDCQTYGCFWFRRSSRAHFLPRPRPRNFLLSSHQSHHRPWRSAFPETMFLLSPLRVDDTPDASPPLSQRARCEDREDFTFQWYHRLYVRGNGVPPKRRSSLDTWLWRRLRWNSTGSMF